MKLGENYEVEFIYYPKDFGFVPGTDGLVYFGRTSCRLTPTLSTDHPIFGVAYCSISENNFERKRGRKEAFTNAVSAIPDKKIRSELWAEYWRKIHR